MKNTTTNAISQRLNLNQARRRFLFMIAIALMLTGLLVFTACPAENGDTSINTSELEATIKEADNERYDVKEAVEASEVPKGVYWVTKSQMTAFNDAIKAAEAVMDDPSSQSLVNATKTDLKTAIGTFKDAKKEGTAAAITLSGTITVKHNGETVPYVEIMAHDQNWDWSERTRLASSEANSPWKIITTPFSKDTEISFRVAGYTDDTYKTRIFSLDVKDVTRNAHNADISNITINLANLKTITLSGTISGSYDGRVVPSMQIQAVSIDINNNSSFLGETNVLEVGDNRPWSMVIEAFNIEARVVFSIFGFDGPSPWVDEQLFYRWGGQDLGVTVKNQDKSGIAITCHVNPLITLSGTIKITYDNEPVPIIGIQVHDHERIYVNSYLAGTDIYPKQSTTPWSIIMEGYKEDKVISFYIHGHSENHEELLFDFGWTENNVTIKDQDITNIVLDMGNIDPEDWWW